MRVSHTIIISCLFLLTFSVTHVVNSQGSGEAEVQIEAIVPGCGDGIIEDGEDCDALALAGATCFSKGFTSGVLSCTASCTYNTSSCVYTPPSTSGGGGGGNNSVSKGAQIVLSGRAYPKSQVTILKDAQLVATTVSDESAHFQVLIKGLSAGTYIFSLYSEDSNGVRSSLFTFPVSVSKGVLAKIDQIFVAPTISGDKIEVKKGEPITLFGQSFPISEITLEVNSSEQFFSKTTAGSDGVYLYNFDSSVLEIGQHHAKTRSSAELAISSQSSSYEFQVGTKNVYSAESIICSKKADFNADCHVNLVDFSIVAFWYNRPLNPAFILREKEHLNGDGKINLVDFSIMAFHWTG
ncbi:MAG: hypothetical protein KBC78_02300 [Candidatus Pacebacteria bacterium]|nr:hypothetical protein [Candidatus Paceibacterota bacterium]